MLFLLRFQVQYRLEKLLDKKLAEYLVHADTNQTVIAYLEQIAGAMEALAEPQKSPDRHSPSSPARPTSPKEPRPTKPRRPVASIQSLVELESAFLQEVCDVGSVRSERRSIRSPLPEAPTVSAPESRNCLAPPDAPDGIIPGLLNSQAEDADFQAIQQKVPQTSQKRLRLRGSNLVIMNQESQANILDSHTQTHLSFEDPGLGV